MQKNNQTKKSNPTATSGRPKKGAELTKEQKKSKNTKTGRRTPSNTKAAKALAASVSATDHGIKTAEENKPGENIPPQNQQNKKLTTTKRKPAQREKELKCEPTQEDMVVEKKEEPKKEKEEPQSGMEVLVKDDKKAVKMDDGYEDFGPGAA